MNATDRELLRAASRVTLLLNPGTAAQRALRVCDGSRVDQRSRALQEAYNKHGEGARLGWLSQATNKVTLIGRNEA